MGGKGQNISSIIQDHLYGHYLKVEVPVPDSLEDGEDLLPGAAHEEQVLGLVQGDDPGVALHRRRALLVLQGHALLAQQVEPLHLHLQSSMLLESRLNDFDDNKTIVKLGNNQV